MKPLPKSWNEVSIKDFHNIQRIIQKEQDELDKEISLLAYLHGTSQSEIENFSISKISHEIKKLSFLSNTDMGGLNVSFKIKGRRYRANIFTQTLSAAQFMDITEFTKENPLDNAHKILAAICEEMTGVWPFRKAKKYDGKDVLKRAEIFYEHLPIGIAYPICVFFCESFQNYFPAMENFLRKEIKKLTKNPSGRIGRGLSPLTH